MRRSRITASAVAGLSSAGLLAGHWLAYAVAHPSAPARHAALAPAHGWLPAAQELVPVLAVIAVATFLLRRVTWRDDDAMDRPTLVRRLATIQVGVFATLEVAERLAAGGWSDLPLILVVGGAAQVLTAWLVAGALRRLSSLGAAIGDAVARAARTPGAAHVTAPIGTTVAVPARIVPRSIAIRAPPSPAG